MIKRLIHCTILLVTALCLGERIAQAQTHGNNEQSDKSVTAAVGLRFLDLLAQRRPARRAAFALMAERGYAKASGPSFNISPMAAGPNLPVMGSGTLGRLTKWTGFTRSNSFIGDSTVFEDKLGNVGIGRDSPTSRLTVAGLMQSTIGGFKFTDGTVQTTSAAGPLFSVAHDATLMGNGTAVSPLGVAVPLILSGSVNSGGVIQATNTTGVGIIANGGMRAHGNDSSFGGGSGVFALGGFSSGGTAGDGVRAVGGDSEFGFPGIGLTAYGGRNDLAGGGSGVIGHGGPSNSTTGGGGVFGLGGASSNGFGGNGMIALGGLGSGAGNRGGIGIEANKGMGLDGATDGLAGKFNGDVEISGNFSVTGTKNFKIDHPLEPENKYLVHAAIESAEVLNLYSGNVRLDPNGEAVVHLPEWFQAINRDFRYSLTPIGAPASGLYIAQEITNSHFKIAGGAAGVKVSWQVTGVRSDPALLKRPFKAEQEKPKRERGTYLNPEAYGQAEERGVEWSRNPEQMQQLKQQRIESKRKLNNK